jgi:hypothetical protein
VSQPSTRKTFLATLAGCFAAVGLVRKLPAQPAPTAPVTPHQPFAIKPEARAVAREV